MVQGGAKESENARGSLREDVEEVQEILKLDKTSGRDGRMD